MIDPNDLLVFLAVARSRTHMGASVALGINHTTVGRRVKALERQLGERLLVQGAGGWELTAAGRASLEAAEGIESALKRLPHVDERKEPLSALRGLVRVSSTEIAGLKIVIPAFAEIRRQHPGIRLELVMVSRPTMHNSSAADLEIGVTKPPLARYERRKLFDYSLGLFASEEYLAEHPRPQGLEDLEEHVPIYYIESMLEVADLDVVERVFGEGAEVLGAGSMLAQLEMTRRGLGIGILPDFVANEVPELHRLLSEDVNIPLTYWMSGRQQNLRRPEVRAVTSEIMTQTHAYFADEDVEASDQSATPDN
jgi:DNA-binding transcriptional LysR family regulator